MKTVQETKAKEEQKLLDLAKNIEKRLQNAYENRMKRMQEVKALAEEVADKVKNIQVFVYDSECNEAQ